MDNVKNINTLKLSEEYYADLFEYYLKYKAYDGLPVFDSILREIPCKQGIADFICYKETTFFKKHAEQIYKLNQMIGKIFIPVVSALLICDKQDISFLSLNTGYDYKRLKKIIEILKGEKIIKENTLKQYSLYANWKKFDVELWAFELKLKNWKRALYQATQYQSFTDKVFTVFPSDKKELLLKNLDIFKKLKVGCILQDNNDMKIEILYQPKKETSIPTYNSPYLFTLTETIMKKEVVNL